MQTKTYQAIGLMSGTSLDGLDVVYCSFYQNDNNWSYKIHFGETFPFSLALKEKLLSPFKLTALELIELDTSYISHCSKAIQKVIKANSIQEVDFISSHGQTLFHQPNKGYTFQLGSGSTLAAKTGITTISDFRTADIALSGQGAPLVPIGDQLLFNGYEYCLNLGGFANVSFQNGSSRIAFDICPVNFVLNQLAQKLNQPFDENGKIAKSGKCIPKLFDALNKIDFYSETPPKSLGAEFVLDSILPLLLNYESYSTEDIMATYTEHAAYQIAKSLNKAGEVLVTGGGAYNTYLIQRIQHYTKAKITLGDPALIEFKEALIFAFLGVLRLENIPNVLSSVTGALKDHCAGTIHLGN
tara:strand:- start:56 stop:1123 length:1068 start_codon:yes stop_codon:yes gene_type:complete